MTQEQQNKAQGLHSVMQGAQSSKPPQRLSSGSAAAHPHVSREYLEEAKRRKGKDPQRKIKVCLSSGSWVLMKDKRTNMAHGEMTA